MQLSGAQYFFMKGRISLNSRISILPNVHLQVVQSDKFKTGCFSINFIRPLRRDEAAKNALIPSVLLWASEKYPSITHISNHLDDLYGSCIGSLVRKKGEVQTTGFYADFLEDEFVELPGGIFSPMVRFAAEILLHPLTENGCFVPDALATEGRNLRNAIEARRDNKRSYAFLRAVQTMCEGEIYAVPRLGEAEELADLTVQELYAHYRMVLATSAVEIFYMGRKPLQTVAEVFREALSELPRAAAQPVQTQIVRRADAPRRVKEQMDVTQDRLCIGLRTDCTVTDTDYPALMLLNVVLGGTSSSKLFLNVREAHSLCYDINSTLDKYKGLMMISAGVDAADFAAAEAAILAELDACRAGNITESEVQTAKQAVASSVKSIQDSPGGLDDFDLGLALCPDSLDLPELMEQVNHLSVEALVRAANRLTVDVVYHMTGVDA